VRGTVRARGKGTWQVQVYAGRTPDGREKRVARTIHGTRRQADEALRDLIRQVETGRHRTDNPTVTELAEQWYATRVADWSPGTARQYRHRPTRRHRTAVDGRPRRGATTRTRDATGVLCGGRSGHLLKLSLDQPCEICEVCDMPETPTATEWLTVAEAADALGCSPDTIRRHCDAGTLASTKTMGGHRRVSAQSVAEHANTAA